jgi:hypothetical protein
VPETPIQSLSDEEIFVKVAEDFRDRRAGDVARDAEPIELAQRAPPSVPLDERFGSGARHRGPAVIQGAFLSQADDGCINLARREVKASES